MDYSNMNITVTVIIIIINSMGGCGLLSFVHQIVTCGERKGLGWTGLWGSQEKAIDNSHEKLG